MAASQERFRLLFVDDALANIKILTEMLRPDYEIVSTDSGEEALRLALEEPQPDLIFLDIMMPKMDGYEVCRRLKADARTRGIPVMFITALTDEQDEEMGLAVGGVDYIRKPFSMAIVRARIKTQLELKRQRDHLQRQAAELAALNARLTEEIEARKRTEAMVQEHLGLLQQLIRDNAFPSSSAAGRNRPQK